MATSRQRLVSGSRSRRPLPFARRRRAVALEGLEPRIVLTQVQYGLFDTGVDGGGKVLAGGATDTHYTLPVTQQGAAGMNAVVASSLPSAWHADGATAAWIAPSANQAASSSPAGPYVYQTSFTLPAGGAGTGQVGGSVSEDDVLLDILINGSSTGFTRADDLGTSTAFDVRGKFVAGTNTLTFVLQNTGTTPNSTGLDVQGLALNLPPAVTVAQATENVTFGGTVTDTGTFADPDSGDVVTLTSSQGTVTQAGTQSGTYTFTQSNVTASGPVTITATDNHGNVQTATFAIAGTAPTIASGGVASTARSGGAAVAVDPGVTLAPATGYNLTTASVSLDTNFTPAEDRLLFANQDGITGAYNATTGVLTLTGTATAAQYQAALRSVQYQDTNANPVTANRLPRSISFSIAPGSYDPANGHFYQFVSAPGITWTAAKAAADASTLYGLKGYLATLTSAAENTFAFSKAQTSGWIGGSDAASPGTWQWADGPENGLQFWKGTVGGTPINGQFNSWASNQPDDSGGDQLYLRFLASGGWDDLDNTANVPGYLVEYGGSTGDPTLAVTSISTVDVTSVSTAPVVTSKAALVNTATTAITGTADAGSLVKVYDDVNGNGTIDPGDAVVATEQLAAGQTAFSIAAPLTANMANHFLATATEAMAAGATPAIESSPVVVPTVTSDTTAPAAPTITSPAGPVAVGTATTYTIAGTAEAGSLVRIYGNQPLESPSPVIGTEQLAAGQTAFSIVVPLSPTSNNVYHATATDAAGNVSPGVAVPVITTAPAAPVISSPAGPVTVGTASYSVTGTAPSGSLVQVYADANGDGMIDDGEVAVGSVQLGQAGMSFAITVPIDTHGDGAYHFLATATDAAGTASAVAVVPTITVAGAPDTTAPIPPTITGPTGAVTTAPGATSYAITGTAEAGSLVRIYEDLNGTYMLGGSDRVAGSEQLAPGQTTFAIAVSATTTNGLGLFLATATDAAGNESNVAVVPAITFAPAAVPPSAHPSGIVYLDLNADGVLEAGEPGLAGRSVYLDLNGEGTYVDGDPTAVTDASGNFTFVNYAYGAPYAIREVPSLAASDRYAVDQIASGATSGLTIGVVPFSPIYPISVVPNPFAGDTGADADANYVQSLYKAILGRAAGDPEVAGWTAAMANGTSAAQVATRINNSVEHRTDQVAAFYNAFLHRAVDPYSQGWVDELLAGTSEEQVAERILDSPEYLAAHPDSASFVTGLYNDVLGRAAGAEEVAGWETALASDSTQAAVISSFVESPEANDQIIESLYTADLHRQREGGTSDVWTTLLAGGDSASDVAVGILSSPEFRAKAAAGQS